ncbi:alpha/beta hydrolase [Mariniflexile sp.]|uniref:alpha/beta hydrolase n=1 Tax=Mariniflexile sp. TaxID=1979402 RepID=UPI003562CC69
MKILTIIDRKIYITILILGIGNILFSQSTEEAITLVTKTGNIQGTLLVADSSKKTPIVLIITGSGPTDRNGNNPIMTNNAIKMLAEGLTENGISSLRFDKRGIAESQSASTNELDLRFETYINDVIEWCAVLKKDSRFNHLIILGHSEGSLIGIMACKEANADKFISVAGAGYPASTILRKQLKEQPGLIFPLSIPIIESLEKGKTVNNPPEMLNALFRPSVQPYLISWFKYNPQFEIASLNIPILIVQGTTDIQVSIEDAEMLSNSNKNAQIVIIENMNHVLKEVEADIAKNIATYKNPKLPLAELLIPSIAGFIKQD